MFARGLELAPDEPEAKQEHAKVVAARRLGERALPTDRALVLASLGRESEAKLDVRPHLARRQRALEPAEFDGAAEVDAVKVQAVVAARVVLAGGPLMRPIPSGVEL